MSRLARINLLLLALLVAHTVDHGVNQPARDLPASGTVIAVTGFFLLAASSVLALRRSPLAPVAAIVAGLGTALGLVAVHLLPGWWGLHQRPLLGLRRERGHVGAWRSRRSSSACGLRPPAPVRRAPAAPVQ